MVTQVSDTWKKFWQQLLEAMYGTTNCESGYKPAELVKRVMVHYEISEIKTNPNNEKFQNPPTEDFNQSSPDKK